MRVPGGNMVPAAGACSRTVPLPTTCTSRPALSTATMTWRIERPTSEGTLRVFAVGITTDAEDCGGCVVAEEGVVETVVVGAATGAELAVEVVTGAIACCAGCWRRGSSLGRSLIAA